MADAGLIRVQRVAEYSELTGNWDYLQQLQIARALKISSMDLREAPFITAGSQDR